MDLDKILQAYVGQTQISRIIYVLYMSQAYRSGVTFFDLAKPSIYYRKGQCCAYSKWIFFVRLTISAAEAPKVTQISLSER